MLPSLPVQATAATFGRGSEVPAEIVLPTYGVVAMQLAIKCYALSSLQSHWVCNPQSSMIDLAIFFSTSSVHVQV